MPAFDFWDIDEILAEQYEVTVRATNDIVGGGLLLPTGAGPVGKDLPEGSKVNVPFWIAQSLVRRNTAVLELPTIYGTAAQEDLQHDPIVCRLGDKSSYYFEVGLRIAHLLKEHALAQDLFRGLQQRAVEIVNILGKLGVSSVTCSSVNQANAMFPCTLTNLEQEMYSGGREAESHFKQWTDRFAAFKMKASSIIEAPAAKRTRIGA
mmetsp:Transcript_81980/g.206262  ORF Transcript_81980/g.206262 Transcript_81980/m.206262 type:complete len:207 (-) Transcript_81980:150-770(-)